MLVPYSPQQIKSYNESNARINVWEGAVRSGKSFICLQRFLKELKEGPAGSYMICGRTERTIKRNIIDPIFSILGDKIHYRQGIGELKILGKKIYLVGCSDQRAEGKIRGVTLAGALVDEVSLIPESFFQMLLSRLSIHESKLFCTTNPDSPFHWLKTKFLDREHELDIKRFHFKLPDNPSLSQSYIDNLKKEYTGLWYQRFVEGKWVLAEGVVYDFFDTTIHTIDVRTKQAKEFILGVDYGTHNPTAFCLIGIDMASSPMCWVEREYFFDSSVELSQKTDYEFASDLKDFIEGLNVKAIYIDPAAASFKAELNRQGVYNILDANNDVLGGIRFVSNMMTTGDLKIGMMCKNLINEIGTYSWDEKSKDIGIDKPKKVNDHLCDALRYGIFTHFKNMSREDDITLEDIRRLERPWQNQHDFYYTPPHARVW